MESWQIRPTLNSQGPYSGLITVTKNTDWKEKYQDAIKEIESKETEWLSLEDLLRKAVGRLSIAGRGHDTNLDKQLTLIQKLSRKKKDQELSDALEQLSNIVASLDSDDQPPPKENQDGDTVSVLKTLLTKLSVIEGLPSSFDNIQADINEGITEDQWRGVLDEVAACISQTLARLGDDKRELENIIVRIIEQISGLSQFISENREDNRSDQKDSLSLQQLMHKRVAKIEENLNSAEDIDQLTAVVTTNIHLIREGVESFVERVKSRHEAVEIRNEKLSSQVSAMEKETSRLQEKLNESSKKLLHDALTGVGSRLAYDEQIVQELARSSRYGSSLCYAILDIDHFKKINDKFGHNAGDKALKIVASLMTKQVRKSDYLFRIGGEEFVLLVTNTELSNAEALVDKIRTSVSETEFHFKQERINLTLSAGVTTAKDNDEVHSIYERADSALYRAKNSGRNCQFVG